MFTRGHHFTGVIKTAHGRYPKQWLDDFLEPHPGGTSIVLTAQVNSVSPIAIGYKYNRKKAICFVATHGAGSTSNDPKRPYKARFRDGHGNAAQRDVPRPALVSTYFENSNSVDCHNKLRQHDLALEKTWPTLDPYFRLLTTLLGMVVTDAHLALRRHTADPTLLTLTMRDFVNLLAQELVTNDLPDDRTSGATSDPRPRATRARSAAPAACEASSSSNDEQHELVRVPTNEHSQGKNRTTQRNCIWCYRFDLAKKQRKTSWQCCRPGCHDAALCHPDTGRNCFEMHVTRGIPNLHGVCPRSRSHTPPPATA